MMPLALLRAEAAKLFTSRGTWFLVGGSVLLTWPMAFTNAGAAELPLDDPRLFSAEPVPLEYQGFEMAGFGLVLVVALSALWAGSEYGSGRQARTTLLATPQRGRVFAVRALLLSGCVAALAFLTMTGAVMITHAVSPSGLDPWVLSPTVWGRLGGVTAAWTLVALLTFSVGSLARSAIVPLILITPLVIGVGDFLSTFWAGARFLPVAAGAALYSDPASGAFLPPGFGAVVLGAWAILLLLFAGVVFARRDA